MFEVSVYAQSNCNLLTVKDILPLTEVTLSRFKTDITNKCFKFQSTYNNMRIYQSNTVSKYSPEEIAYDEMKNGTLINYWTYNPERYFDLLKEFKPLGFKLSEQIRIKDGIEYTYKNTNYVIYITVLNPGGIDKYSCAFQFFRLGK
jgi:hypothetical protein